MALLSSDPSDGCRACGGRGYIPHRGEPYAADPCSCMTDGAAEDEPTYEDLILEGFATWLGDRTDAQIAATKLALAAPGMLAILRRFVSEYDAECACPDDRCLECTLGTTPASRKPRPCPYHEARSLLRELGDDQ